tara:strand:+ start:743 stop:994 length:252 start_codon:yes stop_codon:yes gene_type:complete
MYKLLNEFNINKLNYKDLALLPGFNIPTKIDSQINIVNKNVANDNILDEKMFMKLFNSVDESKNKSTRKRKRRSVQKGKSKKK